jgi:hypothetical protein
MSLSIVNNKVRVKADDGTWYEFPLQISFDRVHHGDLVAVADPGDGSDEHIVLTVAGNNYKVEAITHDERGYLSVNQTPVEEASHDPVVLNIGSAPYRIILVVGPDGRKYLDYVSYSSVTDTSFDIEIADDSFDLEVL